MLIVLRPWLVLYRHNLITESFRKLYLVETYSTVIFLFYNSLSSTNFIISQFILRLNLSVAYLQAANLVQLGISIRHQVSAQWKYLVKRISLNQIVGGHKIHLHTERPPPSTGNEPIPLQYAASEVAELQMHATTSIPVHYATTPIPVHYATTTIPVHYATTTIPVHYAIKKEKNQLIQERLDLACSAKTNILKFFWRFL